jgi:hypothetical protein
MKKTLLALLLPAALFLSGSVNGQYKNAIGIRAADHSGITFKTFLTEDRAADLILAFNDNSTRSLVTLTGLYEIHAPIEGAPGLKWYYGFGGTIGGVEYKRNSDNDLLVRVDGVLGLDYIFDGAPINLSLDWKPALELTPETDTRFGMFGLSVRFAF